MVGALGVIYREQNRRCLESEVITEGLVELTTDERQHEVTGTKPQT